MLTGPLMAANTTGVFSPEVKAGSKAYEYRFSGTEEDGDTGWAQRFHFQQARSGEVKCGSEQRRVVISEARPPTAITMHDRFGRARAANR